MYLDAINLLYEHQSGFGLVNSVATALLVRTNEWYLYTDKRKYTGLIFTDYYIIFIKDVFRCS